MLLGLSLLLVIVSQYATAGPLSIKVVADKTSALPLKKKVFGIHGELMWGDFTYGDSEIVEIYNDIGFQFIRLPGGTPVNYYLWRDGKYGCNGDLAEHEQTRVKNFNRTLKNRKRVYTVENFAEFLLAADTDFSYVVNVRCETVKEIGATMKALKNYGVDIDYVELGNELYGKEYSKGYASASDYISSARKYSDIIKTVYPKARITLNASPGSFRSKHFPDLSNKHDSRNWDFDALTSSADFAQALAVHLYSPPGSKWDVSSWGDVKHELIYQNAISYFDVRFDDSISFFRKKSQKEILLTEWGVAFWGELRPYAEPFAATYYNALYAMNAYLTFFKSEDISASNYHNFTYLDLGDKDLRQNNPLYISFRLLSEVVEQSDKVGPVKLEGARKFRSTHPQYDEALEEINGAGFYGETESYIILVNKMKTVYKVGSLKLGERAIVERVKVKTISFSDDRGKENADSDSAVMVSERESQIDEIELPAYSITRIQISEK